MRVANDLLDKQILDREKRKSGRVDGLIVETRDDEPPRIVAIECGFAVCAARVSERWSRFAIVVGKKLGVRKTPRYRIPWAKVIDVGLDIEVDVDGPASPMMAWEAWWRKFMRSS